MPVSAKALRTQLGILKPLLQSCSLETARKGQNKLGELMESHFRKEVMTKQHSFPSFEGAWIIPKDERRQGVILYLHGGGYASGSLDYAKGFGSMLCVQSGTRVFCAAYRLAPEHPFPAPLEDALEAYRYLLNKGYGPAHITLCGESAGGGLCYCLCLKLKDLGLPLPSGIIALSPWTDLTASGPSYETNRDLDVTMTAKKLDFYADCYTTDRKDPLVSPLFGDLSDMPPSLIFVGGDEIMLSDSQLLHDRLTEAGRECKLFIRPNRWHTYLLYGLEEDQEDFGRINQFLNRHMAQEHKLRWMRLDNAAKIYPAAQRQRWSGLFRISATLTEPVDKEVLQSALDVTMRRFPSIAARLRRGAFWYYLQQLSAAPQIRDENSYPLSRMSRKETRTCAFRVIVYKKRIAVEFFHSLTDGTGGLIFVKTLVAEYLQQKYGIAIPAEKGVLGRLEEPSAEEMEDSFPRYAGALTASRKETRAWRLTGTPMPDDVIHLTCFQVPVAAVLEKAHSYGVTLTSFLTAVMLMALQNIQKEHVPNIRKRTPLKVLVPVNLRALFPSKSLRNFALYSTPEIDPRMGEYSFQEICHIVHHQLGMDVTPKQMSKRIATNVGSEQSLAVRLLPLPLKNLVMKAVFNVVGEKPSCLNVSNLGAVQLPESMMPYVERMDFILSAQATRPHNCSVLSFKDTLYINMVRNIRESSLEYHFHCVLRDMGIPVQVQSNAPER